MINGEEAAILKNNGYTYLTLNPGEHEIKFKLNLGKSIEIILNVESGKSYYVAGFCGLKKRNILYDVLLPFSTAIGYVLTALPEEEALLLISKSKYQEPVKNKWKNIYPSKKEMLQYFIIENHEIIEGNLYQVRDKYIYVKKDKILYKINRKSLMTIMDHNNNDITEQALKSIEFKNINSLDFSEVIEIK